MLSCATKAGSLAELKVNNQIGILGDCEMDLYTVDNYLGSVWFYGLNFIPPLLALF